MSVLTRGSVPPRPRARAPQGASRARASEGASRARAPEGASRARAPEGASRREPPRARAGREPLRARAGHEPLRARAGRGPLRARAPRDDAAVARHLDPVATGAHVAPFATARVGRIHEDPAALGVLAHAKALRAALGELPGDRLGEPGEGALHGIPFVPMVERYAVGCRHQVGHVMDPEWPD